MSPYQRFINSLSDEQLASIARGDAGIGCNDDDYCLVEGRGVLMAGEVADAGLRARLSEAEAVVLRQLYLAQPLCRAEFDYQAGALLAAHGAANFCHHPGNTQNRALMIEKEHLVAVGPEDVRSRYGYFCESDRNVNEDEAAAQVMAWLKSGEAYNDYRTKTTCRYC